MTQKEIAEKLGVSPSIISRVLNGYTEGFKITDDLRKRILDYVEEVGYRPNMVFSALKKQHVNLISILYYSRSSMSVGHTFDVIVDRAIRFFDEHQFETAFSFNCTPSETARYHLPPWKCAGLLIPDANRLEKLSIVEESDIPYVTVNGICGPRGTAVRADEADSMEQIMEHLVSNGHRKIAWIISCNDGQKLSKITSARESTFLACCQRYGAEPLLIHTMRHLGTDDCAGANFIYPSKGVHFCYESPEFFLPFFKSGCTAAICDDAHIMPLLRWAHIGGYRIPDDLSVICYNDKPLFRHTVPAITTFRIPAEEMGVTASQILLKKICGEPDHKKGETLCLKGNLVHRESVKRIN